MHLFKIYISIWFFSIVSILTFYQSQYYSGFDTYFYIFFTLQFFILFSFSLFFKFLFPRKPNFLNYQRLLNFRLLLSFLNNLILVWYLLFLFESIASGGLPFFWNDGRNYKDFGIPVIHGFSNGIRFSICSLLSLIFVMRYKMNSFKLFLCVFPLISALILEQSRGSFVVSLTFLISFFVYFGRFNFKHIFYIVFFVFMFVFLFSFMQYYRYSENQELGALGFFEKITDFGVFFEVLFQPVFDYMFTPIINLNLNIKNAHDFNFLPALTFGSFFPSIIREFLFDGYISYGFLISDAWNTTTIYTPFILDFGLIIGLTIPTLFLIYSIYSYSKSISFNGFHFFTYPYLFSLISLSTFNNYLTTLPFLLTLFILGYLGSKKEIFHYVQK